MQNDCSIYPIPSFARPAAYDFDAATVPVPVQPKKVDLYDELNQINEEIEAWRSRNC